MRRDKKLGAAQHQFRVLLNANLTPAERADSVNYKTGDVLQFHQNAKGFRKGDRIVAGETTLPLEHADRFTAFRPDQTPLLLSQRRVKSPPS